MVFMILIPEGSYSNLQKIFYYLVEFYVFNF